MLAVAKTRMRLHNKYPWTDPYETLQVSEANGLDQSDNKQLSSTEASSSWSWSYEYSTHQTIKQMWQ